eukprot:TRINITY_DN25289_c0_g1_i1.p4 TRINITY_DN25289_c0_g1~~TRINITY_DN25289_c0_g1_i1.p4  ORF type:complete len:119 (-),score=10.96 TRINITY_DN25289_c0_g1_i1:219-575(-)
MHLGQRRPFPAFGPAALWAITSISRSAATVSANAGLFRFCRSRGPFVSEHVVHPAARCGISVGFVVVAATVTAVAVLFVCQRRWRGRAGSTNGPRVVRNTWLRLQPMRSDCCCCCCHA